MDEGPPGAEGYQDSVTEKPKNPLEDPCTKAEQEFQEHLNSLKIKLEDGQTKPMVERRGRDVSGKWIYLCFPCAAMCSGESVLQTHISGKKHKTKLAMRSVWPKSIFEEHPYVMHEKGTPITKGASDKVLQKMAEEVDLHNKPPSELDLKYNKYREVRCHIQDTVDNIKAPLLGLEYLIEHPPEQTHYEPSYICVLCSKQGHPRTIMNHMTCYWHRYNYLVRHFNKACVQLAPFRGQTKFREGLYVIINRLAQRVEDKYGRLKPVNIDKEEYDKDKERIHQWIFKGHHFSEALGPTFEEVVDVDLINTLHKSNEDTKPNPKPANAKPVGRGRDPSPPVVAAPNKPNYRRNDRRRSLDAVSDVSDEHSQVRRPQERDDRRNRDRFDSRHESRYKPYDDRRREEDAGFRSRFAIRNPPGGADKKNDKEKTRPPNYEYKLKLAEEKRLAFEDSAKKTLAYHEVHPEKHPLYPEEWKKFWNRRYKEIQAEGKDPAKHDFKPEWIVFWRARMKELHEEELRINVIELYRKLCLSPPDMNRRSESKRRSPDPRPRSSEPRRRSPDPRRRSPEPRRRSPEPRRRSPEPRRRSPPPRRRSPEPRRRSPEVRRHSPERRRTPPDYRREHHRSPEYRRSSPPIKHLRTRSRSPLPRARSPARTHITLDSIRRSRSPLSRRDEASRNRSPAPALGPASQTVMISDDELKPDDNLSPWNSDNDMDSLGSLPDARSPVYARSHAGSAVSRGSRSSRPRHAPYPAPQGRGADPQDLGPAENIVATLRLLVALEDYLGSLGPKVVDLLTEALKMEKEKPNSSEELLDRESAVVLIETAKEKLKGAMQAGLVPHAASAAVRAAVVRAASTLHEADTRAHRQKSQAKPSKPAPSAPVPVAGVGEVDRAQIAQQMAAALIAQGKTDVSSEELAQLVDAVVGMAEAKKREAETKKKQEARALAEKASRPPKPAAPTIATASALQMLQSAYDENDKKIEKEAAPDAMDGLSDSDLETLLKNFNELSAEEQHSLIAYLKKLEAREPQRVERLRQYVSAAATSAPPTPAPGAPPAPAPAPAPPAPAAPAPAPATPAPAAPPRAEPPPSADDKPTVTIESDEDDDYTVEEVFQTVNQKVREDKIRQEMEIVKKSLEESKASPAPREVDLAPTVDLTNSSSAASLLALVQASIQSGSSAPPAAPAPAGLVASAAHPRSFGDLPAPASASAPTSASDHSAKVTTAPQSNQPYNRPPINNNFEGPNTGNFGGPNPSFGGPNQGSFGGSNQGNFGSSNQDNFGGSNQDNFGSSNQSNFGDSNQSNFGGSDQSNFDDSNQDNFGGSNQGNFGGSNQSSFSENNPENFGGRNQGNFGGQNQGNYGGPNQGNFGGSNSGNFGGSNSGNFGGSNSGNFGDSNQGNFGGSNKGNFGGSKQGNFGGPNQGNFGGPNQGNFGGPNQGNFGRPNQGNFGGPNQGNFGGQNRSSFGGPNQGNFGGRNQGNFGRQNQGSFGAPNQGNFGGSNPGNLGGSNSGNFGGSNPGNFGGSNPGNLGGSNSGNFGGSNPGSFGMNQGNFGGSNQGGFGGNRSSQQQLPSPWEKDTINDNMLENRTGMRPPVFDNFGPGGDQFNNQGPRGNFMNGRMQDNFIRPPGNNFQGNNNFRGRGGRGNFGGRGRGRGFL